METLEALSEALAGTGLSEWLGMTLWAVPMLQSVHIVSIGIVLASSVMLNMRLAGIIGREQSLREMTRVFYPWIIGALLVLTTTGFFQVMAEPGRELLNWIFLLKMVLVIAAVGVTFPIKRLLEDRTFPELAPGKQALFRTCAVVSLILWIAIITCGRWIAYAGWLD